MLKKSASIVLAALRGSTYWSVRLASSHARPCPRNGASWRAGVGGWEVRHFWASCRRVLLLCPTSGLSKVSRADIVFPKPT